MRHHDRDPRQARPARLAATAMVGLLLLTTAPASRAADPAPRPSPGAARPATATERLAAAWPGHPEWVAMLVDILAGSQLGPGDGWFRKGVAETSYDWGTTRPRLDRDGDGAISRSEFAGPDADFARLDRDRDGVLTADDFDFSAHALAPSPGAMLFYRADADSNGKVTRAEIEAFFRANDPEGLGFLSLGDLQRSLGGPPSRPKPGAAEPSGPTKETLIQGLFRQEIGSLQAGPRRDEVAPDFTLATVDGGEKVTLSKLVGPKPVVLIFGNFTCGPFRAQAGNVEKLYRRYKDRATFVMVYVREAHPTDGWSMGSNDRAGVSIRQPRDYAERVGVAQACAKTLELGFPMLVDTIDDAVGARYSGMPSRLYLIDPRGKVAYKSGRGPFGFKPAELEHSLILLLRDEATAAASASATAMQGGAARVPLLSDEEAWKRLPKAESGGGHRLPSWARALAGPMPVTTAVMLEVDRTYRTSDAIDPKLAAAIRMAVAQGVRSEYGRAYAEADLLRAGLDRAAVAGIAHGDRSALPVADRAALAFADRMTAMGSSVTDEEVAALVASFGEAKVVAIVLQIAYANFLDRMALALGLAVEPGGPLPPPEVRFGASTALGTPIPPATRPAPPPTSASTSASVPLAALADSEAGPTSPARIQERLEAQRGRKPRVSIPTWEEFREALPESLYPRSKPLRIGWSLLVSGRQPKLGPAWIKLLRTFEVEAKQDRVFEESLFWVVTRSLGCYYCMGHCEMLLEVAGLDKGAIARRTATLAGDDWSAFPPAERAGFAFARKLTRTPWAVDADDIRRLTDLFGPERALDVVFWSSRCQFMTKVSDAFGLPLERENVFADPPGPKEGPK